jgi:hypothetical protein
MVKKATLLFAFKGAAHVRIRYNLRHLHIGKNKATNGIFDTCKPEHPFRDWTLVAVLYCRGMHTLKTPSIIARMANTMSIFATIPRQPSIGFAPTSLSRTSTHQW